MNDSDKFGIERRGPPAISGPTGVPMVYGDDIPHPEIDVGTIRSQVGRQYLITVAVAGTFWSASVRNRCEWREHWAAARMIRTAMDSVDREVSHV